MRCTDQRAAVREVNGSRTAYSHRCGQCMACRITRRQEWVLRCMLELVQNPIAYFVTLTYCEEHVPLTGRGNVTLEAADLQRYWKRLRKSLPGVGIRYFACGEYGDKKGRPHYHALVWTTEEVSIEYGLQNGRLQVVDSVFARSWHDCCIVDVVPVPSGEDGARIARYVAGYVTKKMTTQKALERSGNDDPEVEPEFGRSSRRPGIGLGAAGGLAAALRSGGVARSGDGRVTVGLGQVPRETLASGEVPRETPASAVRVDGKLWPMDRRLREKVLEALGLDERTDLGKALGEDIRSTMQALEKVSEAELEEDRQAYWKAVRRMKRARSGKTF